MSLNEVRLSEDLTVHPANYKRATWLSGPIPKRLNPLPPPPRPRVYGCHFRTVPPGGKLNLERTEKIFENSVPSHHLHLHPLSSGRRGGVRLGYTALEVDTNAGSAALGRPKPAWGHS